MAAPNDTLVIARYRTGDTLPEIVIPLNLGNDPETDAPRTLNDDDTVTMIMRNTGNSDNPTPMTAAVVISLDILDADANTVRYIPVDGDLDDAGDYEVMWQRATADDDIESFPDEADLDQYIRVTGKPND